METGSEEYFFWDFISSFEKVEETLRSWTRSARVKDAWMDMLPLSVMSQGQRDNQYRADVARTSIAMRRRNDVGLDPHVQTTKDHWHATQVSINEKSCPFSDNLTTLMFIVANNFSEVQERVPFLSKESMSLLTHLKNKSCICGFVLHAKKFIRESFTPSEQIRPSHKKNLHCRRYLLTMN